ncbi:LysM peptidoglycan-binding domain-containing protein [Enterococcus quebecensis]|uniref:LysM domain-containing protein n=1 Tax=Enterococcus quebecensis TaxID=903983 RepID=A0A1E5GWD0_9ENTE|nr:LysM peptidoglycan-binding domain-containing protein [Enterococcus quebecensis]OEG16972.1 hypothetical protein BCR23_02890 [Enterococcus quebecensis]OJG75337.1 hypothetical protein RV12_GL001140 [Enterococcus quebecensis]
MKKRINKKYSVLLIFSTILFSTAIYSISDSVVLGASAGGAVSVPTAGVGADAPPPAPVVPSVQEIDPPKRETTAEGTSTSSAENKNSEAPKEVYIVKDGQTLWEIAQDSGQSVQTLMNKNQLSSGVIIEGQELVFD